MKQFRVSLQNKSLESNLLLCTKVDPWPEKLKKNFSEFFTLGSFTPMPSKFPLCNYMLEKNILEFNLLLYTKVVPLPEKLKKNFSEIFYFGILHPHAVKISAM